jgi:hypothetical protein
MTEVPAARTYALWDIERKPASRLRLVSVEGTYGIQDHNLASMKQRRWYTERYDWHDD